MYEPRAGLKSVAQFISRSKIMSEKVTVTKKYLDSLKTRNAYLEKENDELRGDRSKFREFFLKLLREQVTMNSKNEYKSTSAMILDLSKLLNSVHTWYWG